MLATSAIFLARRFCHSLKNTAAAICSGQIKCKQPYIDILEEPVKGCECHRNKRELLVPTVISQYISLLERNTLKHV